MSPRLFLSLSGAVDCSPCWYLFVNQSDSMDFSYALVSRFKLALLKMNQRIIIEFDKRAKHLGLGITLCVPLNTNDSSLSKDSP